MLRPTKIAATPSPATGPLETMGAPIAGIVGITYLNLI